MVTRPGQDLLAELERAGLPGAAEDGIAEAVTRRLASESTAERIELLEAAVPDLLNIPHTLSELDLRDIITRPAQKAGGRLEHGLPEQVIADVLAITPEAVATKRAPVTVLPLLELALSQLWQRRDEGYLTHDAYRRIGGVTGSLTTWCDTALGQLPAEQLPVAQRILTSLVRPADPDHHIPAIREQVPLRELRELAANSHSTSAGGETVDEVLASLARHRIITTYTPQISDPSQTRSALRDWVAHDHRFRDWFERTRHQRARWAQSGDPTDLLRGRPSQRASNGHSDVTCQTTWPPSSPLASSSSRRPSGAADGSTPSSRPCSPSSSSPPEEPSGSGRRRSPNGSRRCRVNWP
ncbi:hypothetical protein ABZ619_42050 [Streptomyces sp. NPDC007851]|uniref:nSTAND1 domain-containing NTPase n=1 Tax=Streptomyces sp. NPDC007851 TaxID=3155008 RepID=UPI0033C46AEF